MLVLWPFLAGIQFNMSQSITTSSDCASVFLSLCSSSAWAVLLVSSSTVTAAVIAGDVVASVTWAPSQKSWVVLYEARAQVQLPGGLGPVVLQNISDLNTFPEEQFCCQLPAFLSAQHVCLLLATWHNHIFVHFRLRWSQVWHRYAGFTSEARKCKRHLCHQSSSRNEIHRLLCDW